MFCFRGESLPEVPQNQTGFCLERVSPVLIVYWFIFVCCVHANYFKSMCAIGYICDSTHALCTEVVFNALVILYGVMMRFKFTLWAG